MKPGNEKTYHKAHTPKTATRSLGSYMVIAFVAALLLAAVWISMHA
ncbi:hypothetical protein SAMN05518849_12217 [Sphingobium sp. AP50]|jgi:hypothetical protein|nr:hypothetical protein SAMN05518849_12217 [Sphingobium sp. AP50]